MGNGRFLRQDNGDNIFVTEEVYWSGKSIIAIICGFIFSFIGYKLDIDWFNLHDFGFIFFIVGIGFIVMGIIGLLIVNQYQKVNWGLMFGFIFGTLLALGGLYWYFSKSDAKEKNDGKKQKTTVVADNTVDVELKSLPSVQKLGQRIVADDC